MANTVIFHRNEDNRSWSPLRFHSEITCIFFYCYAMLYGMYTLFTHQQMHFLLNLESLNLHKNTHNYRSYKLKRRPSSLVSLDAVQHATPLHGSVKIGLQTPPMRDSLIACSCLTIYHSLIGANSKLTCQSRNITAEISPVCIRSKLFFRSVQYTREVFCSL
jgi:hypothetical protein